MFDMVLNASLKQRRAALGRISFPLRQIRMLATFILVFIQMRSIVEQFTKLKLYFQISFHTKEDTFCKTWPVISSQSIYINTTQERWSFKHGFWPFVSLEIVWSTSVCRFWKTFCILQVIWFWHQRSTPYASWWIFTELTCYMKKTRTLGNFRKKLLVHESIQLSSRGLQTSAFFSRVLPSR